MRHFTSCKWGIPVLLSPKAGTLPKTPEKNDVRKNELKIKSTKLFMGFTELVLLEIDQVERCPSALKDFLWRWTMVE